MAESYGEAGLANQLREAIRRSGKSLNQLSKESGVGSDRLSRFMRGQRDLTVNAAEKICQALRLRLIGEQSSSEPVTKPRKRRKK